MMSISKQAYMIDGKLTMVPLKTANSVRKIALSEVMMAMLKKQRAANESSYPSGPNDSNSPCNPRNPYIFSSPVTGEMYHPDSVVYLHKKILIEAVWSISVSMFCAIRSLRWPYNTAWT